MNTGKYQQQLTDYMTYKKYSEQSIKSYVSSIGKFLEYFKDVATKPSEISAKQIMVFLSMLTQANTHKAYLSAIKLFYSKVGNQPLKLDKLEFPKSSKKLPIVLSQAEIQRMFDACHNLKHKVILSLLYSAGLRVSELLNLKWEHIDRSRMIINIISGKGKKDRQVGLSEDIIPLLEKYFRNYKTKNYILKGQFIDQYSATSVNQVIKQLAKSAGIKKRVYTHLIRHCTFTHMVEQGTDINLIQRIAGHANVKTTAVYCHISHNLISSIQSPIKAISI